MNTFLTAKWKYLLMANYAVDKNILIPYLPARTAIDLWENKCYISLVGFLFEDTTVKGLKVPLHTNFEEINLRFYVTQKQNRGVVFIKEYVPKTMLAGIANTLYGEHYESTSMAHYIDDGDENLSVGYGWKRKGRWNEIAAVAGKKLFTPKENSVEAFIAEHYFGYVKIDEQTTTVYEVQHPKWEVYNLLDYTIDVDFELNYGKNFAFLNHQKPENVLLAKGSVVNVLKADFV